MSTHVFSYYITVNKFVNDKKFLKKNLKRNLKEKFMIEVDSIKMGL